MRRKTIAKLFVISVVILAGSPAVATPIAHNDTHCRHQKFGPCVSPKVDASHWNGGDKTHDGWPANMILG
jgi:hypothetical protein